VQFIDQSTDPFGTINKWKWDFGDGTTSTLKDPSHTYTTVGFYTVGLTITSTTGCSAEAARFRMIRVVSGVTPDFNPKFDSVCNAPFAVQFMNQSSGPELCHIIGILVMVILPQQIIPLLFTIQQALLILH
jgi:PKD repeat protein